MSLWQWSPTAANNATAASNINWQEGQAPSTVNDSARQMMADVATWFQSPDWPNFGDVPTYIGATQFTVPGNLTARYSVGRRVKAAVTAGTIYGIISASAYTALTTVTVTWDAGASLDSGLSSVACGIINPLSSALGNISNSFQSGGNVGATGNVTAGGNIAATGNITAGGSITAAGVVTGSDLTASSDERLKEDWRPMAREFLQLMSGVLYGTFTRKSDGSRSAGVGAGSLREVFPEVVHEDAGGMLSVAYGQAALVTVLEMIPIVLRLLDAHGETP